jgi:hypothetical protein
VRSDANQERNKLDLYRMLQTADFAELKDVFTRFFASIPHDWYRKNQLAGCYYASIVYCYFVALGLDVCLCRICGLMIMLMAEILI